MKKRYLIVILCLMLCLSFILQGRITLADNAEYKLTTITCDGKRLEVVKIGNRYYAYIPEMNYYVFHETTLKEDVLNQYILDDGAVIVWDSVYSSTSSDWSKGKDKKVFQTMEAFYKVAAWYRDVVGYQGIDGNGGCALLVADVKESSLGSPAANYGEKGYITFTSSTVIDSQEILAHEYGHALIANLWGIKNFNECGALHEGLADVFASLFDPDQDWHIGPKGKWRDIAEGNYITGKGKIRDAVLSLDDFEYDLASENSFTATGELGLWESILSQTGVTDHELNTSSKHKYRNSFIISHTMYLIWKNEFKKDSQKLAHVLYRTIKYLDNADRFSEFRSSFLAVMKDEGYSQTMIDKCAKRFDNATIKNSGAGFAELLEKRIASDKKTLTTPANADEWAEFLGQNGFFGKYTGSAMDAQSLKDIHIAFGDVTGDGVEEMVAVWPFWDGVSDYKLWNIEVYQKDEYGVFMAIYSHPINLGTIDIRYDLIQGKGGVSFLLYEWWNDVSDGYAEKYDRIRFPGGEPYAEDGIKDVAKRTDDTLLVYVEENGTVRLGGHTIPEFFPNLY